LLIWRWHEEKNLFSQPGFSHFSLLQQTSGASQLGHAAITSMFAARRISQSENGEIKFNFYSNFFVLNILFSLKSIRYSIVRTGNYIV